uniref:Uncharacterized protein n=1 Tax=Anguilla anguilla TaxID=7936 RepID=A0A0E9XFD6_ANGAN
MVWNMTSLYYVYPELMHVIIINTELLDWTSHLKGNVCICQPWWSHRTGNTPLYLNLKRP